MFLSGSTQKLSLTTASGADVDVSVDYSDNNAGTLTYGNQLTAITTAATTDILAAPSGSVIRNAKRVNIRNIDASASNDVTVQINTSGTLTTQIKYTLNPGDVLTYSDYLGTWYPVRASQPARRNFSTSSATPFSSDTYLAGSSVSVPTTLPAVGDFYRLVFDVAKTGAGTATPIIIVRFGTAGTTGDTARLTFTYNAGTANADVGVFVVEALFRTVGSGSSAVLQGRSWLTKGLTATTGIVNTVGQALQVTSGGFDSTVASSIIGASYNGGASAAHTVQLVRAEYIPANAL